MGKLIDLTGQQFGRLMVIKRITNNNQGSARWLCQCECGKTQRVQGGHLRAGYVQSCGCLHKESLIRMHQANICHGHTIKHKRTTTYNTWDGMIQRCTNEHCKQYKDYGGRGIQVCEAWTKFEGFLQDMGKRPPNLTLDRVDNNGNYCKENCKWSNRKEQMRNYRNNKLITINGITKCFTEWCEYVKLPHERVRSRVRRGWSIQKALGLE